MIPSFEIENFRLFKHLVIDKFSRVNLITGKNNVGKTALLEALRLYSTEGNIEDIYRVIKGRNKYAKFEKSDIIHLFNYKKSKMYNEFNFKGKNTISLKPVSDEKNSLKISTVRIVDEWEKSKGEESFKRRILGENEEFYSGQMPGLSVIFKEKSMAIPIFEDSIKSFLLSHPNDIKRQLCFFVPAHIRDIKSIMDWWDKTIFTPEEKTVVECLRLIIPNLGNLAIIGEGETSKSRYFIAKTTDIDFPIPFTNFGEGVNRLLGIVISLVNAKNDILCIDEIENGIHYSIQPKLWKLILELAERLDVQVFVTTHSWDAVEGFQEALNEFHDPEQGQLIRLKEKNGDVISTVFNAKDLAITTRDNLEVR